MRIFWLLSLALLLVSGHTEDAGPSCNDDNDNGQKKEIEDSTTTSTAEQEHAAALAAASPSCGLWWFQEEDTSGDFGWLVAGKWYHKHDVIGFPLDVVQQFTQQSRRGFVTWNRFYHLYGKHPTFTYAPGTEGPFQCHARLFNAKLDPTTFQITADRSIAPGEPIFVECSNDYFSVDTVTSVDDFPIVDFPERLEDEGANCLDQYEFRKHDNDDGGSVGVYATRPLSPDSMLISWGKVLHFHRAELYNETSGTHEPLLQYTYGHPQTDVLLLPNFPIASSIRHGRPANVALEFYAGKRMRQSLFGDISEHTFGQFETSYFKGGIMPLREIAPGEELLLDYGDAYHENYVNGGEAQQPLQQQQIIQERAVPKGFFPESWLQEERRRLASEMPSFDITPLKPGEVASIRFKDGSKISEHLHRVGLPDSLADTMESWAEGIGLLNVLKRYVTDKALPVDGEERIRVNNGTWWAKRFDSSWQSNMHYVATDDDESTEQMFHALHRGGFDQVLQAIGTHFNLTKLTCHYATYIVVNHCVRSHVHSDSDDPGIFNFIFPVVQYDNGEPELILASDDGISNSTPYVYERNAGVLLGLGGMHGTAATDYRESGKVRIVVSVYMGDFSDEDVLEEYIEDWADPPYPIYYEGQLHHALANNRHWDKNDPTVSIGGPLSRAFPLRRLKPEEDKLKKKKKKKGKKETLPL